MLGSSILVPRDRSSAIVARRMGLLLFLGACMPTGVEGAQGWYLLLPPLEKAESGQINVNGTRPLSAWDHEAAFDNAADCERLRIAGQQRYVARDPQDERNRLLRDAFLQARCIASDDSRLRP
jgi:hypothetical protein